MRLERLLPQGRDPYQGVCHWPSGDHVAHQGECFWQLEDGLRYLVRQEADDHGPGDWSGADDLAEPSRQVLRSPARCSEGMDRWPPVPAVALDSATTKRRLLALHPVPHDPQDLARGSSAAETVYPPLCASGPDPALVVDGERGSRIRALERRAGPGNHQVWRQQALGVSRGGSGPAVARPRAGRTPPADRPGSAGVVRRPG